MSLKGGTLSKCASVDTESTFEDNEDIDFQSASASTPNTVTENTANNVLDRIRSLPDDERSKLV